MLKRLRGRLTKVAAQKFQSFSDFEPIIRKILNDYGHLFPRFRETRSGSKYVYHFNVEGVAPISLEKEHGSRDFIPRKYARFAIQGISDVLTYVESQINDEREVDPAEKDHENEHTFADQEDSRTLSESEIPDGDS